MSGARSAPTLLSTKSMLKKRIAIRPESTEARPERLVEKKRKMFWRNFTVVSVIVLILLVGLCFSLRMKEVTISNIYVYGNSAVSSDDVKNDVNKTLEGNYLFIFPKKNIFLYPKEEIREKLRLDFPRLSSATVSFKDWNSVDVSVTEYEPFANWCINKPLASDSDTSAGTGIFATHTKNNNDCYFLNHDGLIFSKSPYFSGNVFLRYFGGGVFGEPVGQRLLSKNNQFEIFNEFVKSLRDAGFTPTDIFIEDDGNMVIYLTDTGKLIVKNNQDFTTVLVDLKNLIGNKDFKGRDKNGRLHFQYIDLRGLDTGDKIFYKI